MSRSRDDHPRPEDRPIDPEAVRRFEQLPAPASTHGRGSGVGGRGGAVRPSGARNNLVTTAGGVLVVVGAFIAVVAVLAVAPSEGLDVFGLDLDGDATAALFVGLAIVYAIAGALILMRRPIGRALGFVVGALALAIGLAQLRTAGLNAIPTVGVAAFVLYALGIGGADFRRR